MASTVPFGDRAQSYGVFGCEVSRATAFDLDEDDLQSVAALEGGGGFAVVLADRHQVND